MQRLPHSQCGHQVCSWWCYGLQCSCWLCVSCHLVFARCVAWVYSDCAGLRLHVATILRSRIDAPTLAWFGILCSSWVATSRGSIFRTWLVPEGVSGPAVDEGNCMAARCSFLFLLIHALGGVWALEQPRSLLLMQYGRMRDVAARIQVYDVAFWMAGFGAKTPKRSMLWSNSIGCMHFQTPKLSMKKAKLLKDVDFGEPVMKYVHKGKKCWKGTRWLTATGIYTRLFGKHIVEVFKRNHMKPPVSDFPLKASMQEAQEAFEQESFDDLVADGRLIEVIRYLRSLKGLKIPESWRPLVPTKL
ncbi:unnamed protein product [Durusdinium trenchii]|uniref:Uncharacterized protein n=1 Tax=Durusdinium trenchii TaxID=1381693 RepID=A0ABP0J9J3_9DINO